MNKKLKIIYLISFLLSTAYAFTAYTNSSYLSTFIPTQFVGLIFSIAAFMAILGLIEIPKILAKKGDYKVSFWVLILSILSLLGLAIFESAYLAIFAFIAYIVLSYLFGFTRDIFTESYSEDQSTGKIRGTLLTAINLGWVFAPFVSALFIEKFGYRSMYLLAAMFFIPAIILLKANFKDFKDKIYESVPFWQTLKKIMAEKDLKGIYLSNFLLQFFYSWMIIYTPIYLHQYMHFGWTEIGLMFIPMLIPFVILQYPLGVLSDKIGEKKMLYLGFAVMILSTIALSYLPAGQFWLWAGMLFLTRAGAATVEVMTESYFFKKVSARQDETISFYRNTGPISLILGPIIAGIFLFFFPFQYLFLALGIILILSFKYTYQLNETL